MCRSKRPASTCRRFEPRPGLEPAKLRDVRTATVLFDEEGYKTLADIPFDVDVVDVVGAVNVVEVVVGAVLRERTGRPGSVARHDTAGGHDTQLRRCG